MRHLKAGRKLGKTTPHRKAMMRNLVTSLLEHERIKTTDAKAKELRRVADRMITLGKRGDLHARRRALSYIRSKQVVAKLFDDLAERFRDRQGGYTRVVKIGYRAGDAAPMSFIELVKEEVQPKAKKKPKKKAKPAAKKPKEKAAAKKKPKKEPEPEVKEPEVAAEPEAAAEPEPQVEEEAPGPEADEETEEAAAEPEPEAQPEEPEEKKAKPAKKPKKKKAKPKEKAGEPEETEPEAEKPEGSED